MSEEEKKVVHFDVWNLETDEIETLEMDEEDFKAWVEAEEAEQKKLREGLEASYQYDREAWQYVRDDD